MGKRSTDSSGPTPGERVEKWLGNAKIALALWIALGGTLTYANSERVRNWVHGADDITPSTDGFNEQVIHAIEVINSKLGEQQIQIDQLSKRDKTDQYKLQSQINTLKKWHD